MAATEIELRFNLNPGGQELFDTFTSTYRGLMGGLSSGKTTTGAFKAVEYMIEHPRSVGMILAPINDTLKAATLPAFFEQMPDAFVKQWHKGDRMVECVNGSKVWFRSTERPDNLKGPNLNWFWLDEAALMPFYVWQIMVGRIRLKNHPAMGMITTTPKGRNWIWRLFYDKSDMPDKLKASYSLARAPTRENKANLREGFIEELGYSGSYAAQELEGEFVTFEGLVYRNFSREKHLFSVATRDSWLAADKFKRFIAGVDWGFTNPGVILPHGFDGDGRAYQLEEHYQRRIPVISDDPEADTWVKRAMDIAARYEGIEFACDPSEPAFIEAFRSKGLNAYGAINDIQPGISALYSRLDNYANGAYGWQACDICVNTVSEMEIYHYADPSGNRSGNEKPVKEGDHAMDSARYAVAAVDLGITMPSMELGFTPVVAKRRGW